MIHCYKYPLSRVLVVRNTFYSIRYKDVTQATFCPSEFRLFVFSRSAADFLSHTGITTQPEYLREGPHKEVPRMTGNQFLMIKKIYYPKYIITHVMYVCLCVRAYVRAGVCVCVCVFLNVLIHQIQRKVADMPT